MNKDYWDTIYTLAKEFGWTKEYIDNFPAKEMMMLASARERHIKEQERQDRKMNRKISGRRSML